MPRNPLNPAQFIAGALPIVHIQGCAYYVDGRLEQLRNVNDFTDSIDCIEDDLWDLLTPADRSIIAYEFMGETLPE